MRRITVRGDFESSGLWENEKNYLPINPHDLDLPENLIRRLAELVRDYAPILPLPQAKLDTPEIQNRIHAIDARGVELTREISKFLGEKFHLRYYREGLRKFVGSGEASKVSTCPVCGFPSLSETPRTEKTGGSYEICPSCGFQFGVTDGDRGITFDEWRDGWISRGMPWSSSGIKPPPGWNPETQLRNIK